MTRQNRKLYRDPSDKKIGGVCSGLGRYFDIDPLLVRVGFVATLMFGGASILAYLLLWWLVDEAPAETADEAPAEGFDPPAAPVADSDAA